MTQRLNNQKPVRITQCLENIRTPTEIRRRLALLRHTTGHHSLIICQLANNASFNASADEKSRPSARHISPWEHGEGAELGAFSLIYLPAGRIDGERLKIPFVLIVV
jgi:hypothetical protein